jgi:HlyD family secretion protein
MQVPIFVQKLILKMKIYFYTFCFLLSLAACNKEKIVKPEYRAFVDAVYASGKVQPQGGHKIFAMNDGILDEQLINEGEKVSVDQAIFKIENNAQNSRLRNAREVYKVAIENTSESSSPVLQELKNQINSLRIKLLNDSVNYTRFKNLLAENATTNAEFDRASWLISYQKVITVLCSNVM